MRLDKRTEHAVSRRDIIARAMALVGCAAATAIVGLFVVLGTPGTTFTAEGLRFVSREPQPEAVV